MQSKDLFLRFLLGGASVVLSYIFSMILPWKEFGGIFAAFPAVMVIAVVMTGSMYGSNKAELIAQGAVYGMLGCTVCVLTILLLLHWTRHWWASIGAGLISWYVASLLIARVAAHFQEKRPALLAKFRVHVKRF